MNIYLAGPMRGLHDFGFPAFDQATALLRGQNHTVYSPAEHDRSHGFDETLNSLDGFDMEDAMRWDLGTILTVDAVAVLPGWRSSAGVKIELGVARAVGVKLYAFDEHSRATGYLHPLDEDHSDNDSPLFEAHALVHGARGDNYGPPIEDFTRTGRLWAAILGIDEVTPRQVGLCMVALKISRHCNKPKRDNLVDIAGYTETVHLCDEATA